jgi:hypothetical protein
MSPQVGGEQIQLPITCEHVWPGPPHTQSLSLLQSDPPGPVATQQPSPLAKVTQSAGQLHCVSGGLSQTPSPHTCAWATPPTSMASEQATAVRSNRDVSRWFMAPSLGEIAWTIVKASSNFQ